MSINEKVELAVCDTFSKGCFIRDFTPPYPRFRQHSGVVEIQPYLRGGSNELRIERRPDGEAETLYFSVVRVEGRSETVLAEGELAPEDTRGRTIVIDTPSECRQFPLPDMDWLGEFLDPFPEALRSLDGAKYAQMLIPPTAAKEAVARETEFQVVRILPIGGDPLQTHRSVPLAMNYSCENGRLFVFPEDGGDLILFAEIETHSDGSSSRWISSRVAELVYDNNRWYLGRLQSPETP